MRLPWVVGAIWEILTIKKRLWEPLAYSQAEQKGSAYWEDRRTGGTAVARIAFLEVPI